MHQVHLTADQTVERRAPQPNVEYRYEIPVGLGENGKVKWIERPFAGNALSQSMLLCPEKAISTPWVASF